MFDSKLMYRDASAGALQATATLPANPGLDVGPDLVPQMHQVHVPQATGTTPTLDIKIQESDDGTTWRDYVAMPQITAAGEYFITTKSDARYRRMVFTVGGTTPNFGIVEAGPVPAGRYTKF